MESNFIMNGIEKSTDDSILIEMEFACCRCAAQCYFVLDLMFVLCEYDDKIIKKFLESITMDTIISSCKILTSHFSIQSFSLPNKMNARTNLGITCKQDILKQDMFATLANNLNESEKGFLIYNRSFHFRSKSAFPLILLDVPTMS